jgi:hypothetical protein
MTPSEFRPAPALAQGPMIGKKKHRAPPRQLALSPNRRASSARRGSDAGTFRARTDDAPARRARETGDDASIAPHDRRPRCCADGSRTRSLRVSTTCARPRSSSMPCGRPGKGGAPHSRRAFPPARSDRGSARPPGDRARPARRLGRRAMTQARHRSDEMPRAGGRAGTCPLHSPAPHGRRPRPVPARGP